MIKRLRRLLGWDSESATVKPRPPQRSAATGAARPSPAPVRLRQTPVRGGSTTAPGKAAGRKPQPADGPVPRGGDPALDEHDTDDLLRLLEDPELTLDTSEQAGFDPYNTGAFDRSASWDRISKNRTR